MRARCTSPCTSPGAPRTGLSTALTRKTATHYGVQPRMHEGRGHWIIGEPGWESLVDDVAGWLDKNLK